MGANAFLHEQHRAHGALLRKPIPSPACLSVYRIS